MHYKITVSFFDDRASVSRYVSGKSPSDAMANLAIELAYINAPVCSMRIEVE